jgi:hypothetical protein
MATLQEVIGDRVMMDEHLRQRAQREYDAMAPVQQRAAYVHQARIIHEVAYMLQLASDGHTTFRSDKDLLDHITALVWSTDGAESASTVLGAQQKQASEARLIECPLCGEEINL